MELLKARTEMTIEERVTDLEKAMGFVFIMLGLFALWTFLHSLNSAYNPTIRTLEVLPSAPPFESRENGYHPPVEHPEITLDEEGTVNRDAAN